MTKVDPWLNDPQAGKEPPLSYDLEARGSPSEVPGICVLAVVDPHYSGRARDRYGRYVSRTSSPSQEQDFTLGYSTYCY